MADAQQYSESFARQVLASIGDAVIVTDTAGRIVLINPQAQRLTGWPADQAQGRLLAEVFHVIDGETRQPADDPVARVLRLGSTVALPDHALLIAKDGQETPISDTSAPVRGDDGEVHSVVLVFRDCSVQRQVERSLRWSESRFRKLFESNMVGIAFGNGQGGFSGGNDEFLRIIGYSRSDVEAGTVGWRSITPPEYTQLDEAGRVEVAARGSCTPYRKEYIRKDGIRVPVLVGYTLLEGSRDQFISFILDLTPQKEAEEAMRQSQERLNQAVRVARLGIFEHDHHTDEIHWSRLAREILGFEPTGPVTIPMLLERIHPEDRLKVGERIRRAHDPSGDGIYRCEYRITHPAGGIRWIYAQSRTFFASENGVRRPSRTIGADMDITDRKQNEFLLHAAKTAAEEANAAKDHFLAVLSHELRTPLTPALATVNLLESDAQLPQHYRDDIEMIRRNVELEAKLIDDLLDVTRIVRGKVELDKHPVELRHAIDQAIGVCRRDIDVRALHFRVDLHDAADAVVDADPARLQQVFWNLLKNAIKFTSHAGHVEIIGRREGQSSVTIEVRDDGIGIEPELLPRLFRAFEQGGAGTTRQFGGLGLGLAITRGLVEMHGGTINASSAGKGKGASFVVCLPLSTGTPVQQPVAPAVPAILQTETQPKAKILYVEDHGDTARIMQRILATKGYAVQTAGDVATALQLAESEPFDVLLSDLGLPDGSGIDLIRELRQRGHTLPAIALSGYGQEEDIRRSKDAGFAAHLVKPADPARLVAAIAEVTTNHKPA